MRQPKQSPTPKQRKGWEKKSTVNPRNTLPKNDLDISPSNIRIPTTNDVKISDHEIHKKAASRLQSRRDRMFKGSGLHKSMIDSRSPQRKQCLLIHLVQHQSSEESAIKVPPKPMPK